MATRDLARLVVRLEAQTSRYVRELDRANSKLASFEAATKRSLSAIDTAFKRVLTGATVVALARAVTNLSDQFTELQNSLRVTGLQGRDLEAVQSRLFAAANRNGVEIAGLAQLYRRSALASRELGASQTQLLQFVDGVSAALRVQGGSAAAATGAIFQLSQALGSGVVRSEEFNSIVEGATPIAQAAANGIERFGGSISKLQAEVKKGKVTSREFFEGFLRGAKDLEAQAANTSQTVGQAFVVLQNNLVRVVGGFAKSSGVTDSLASAVVTLANNLENLARVLAVAAVAAGAFAAVSTVERIVALTRAVATATPAFVELFLAIAKGDFILLGSAAAERARAAATVEAAQAEVARTTAVLAATRAEQAKAVVVFGSTEATNASAVAAVAAARAEYARASAVLASARAETANAAASAAVLNSDALRVATARTLIALEEQQLAAHQALIAAEARLAAATTATNTAMFARTAAAKQVAALEAQVAAAQVGLARAQVQANAAAGASMGALRLRLQSLGQAFASLGAPVRGLFAVISRHPVGLLVTAIAAAVAALVVFSDRIKTSADGVITLRDTALATWRIIGEALEPLAKKVGEIFKTISTTVVENFRLMREVGATVYAPFIAATELAEKAAKKAAKFIPAVRIAVRIAEGVEASAEAVDALVIDPIQDRARRIARIRNFVPGARQRTPPGQKPSLPAAAPTDEAALKKIQELEVALRQQVATFGKGEIATIKYRIAQGDLADEFKKAGAAAEPYRAKLVQLTAEHETQKLEQFATELEQQVASYELTGGALVEFRLKVGDLSKAYTEAIAAGGEFAKRVEEAGKKAKDAADKLEGKQLEKTLKGIRAELAELRGETDEAFRIRFEVEHEDLRRQLEKRGDKAGLADLDELERQGTAVAKFNELQAESERIRDRLQKQEERIARDAELGAIGQFDALAKTGEAREKAAKDLDEILKKQKAIADQVPKNKELAESVEDAAASYEELANQVDVVGLHFKATLEESLEGPLVDFLTGTQSAEDAFKSFLKTLEREIIAFIAKDLMKRLLASLFRNFPGTPPYGGPTAGGGGGFPWGAVASFVGGLFGGSAASGPALAGSAASGAFTIGGPVMVAAEGGTFAPRVPTLVGERGPELVVPRNADLVVPNHDLRGMMREPAVQVVNNFSLAPIGGQVERRTLSQIAAATARSVADAARRNN